MCSCLKIKTGILNRMIWRKQQNFQNFCTIGNTPQINQVIPTVSRRVVSGIQPTGVPHIGNYFGAIKTWVKLQNSGYDCIFSIVDLHSITLPQDPEKLRTSIYMTAACLLACGINPESSILFLQSQVPQHAELSWILGSFVTMARLNHMPQFKERANGIKEIPLGIYIYPILQSADILLYKNKNTTVDQNGVLTSTTNSVGYKKKWRFCGIAISNINPRISLLRAVAVPVGSDQLQHIQLAQHLAKIFNNKYKNIFPYPKTLTDLKSNYHSPDIHGQDPPRNSIFQLLLAEDKKMLPASDFYLHAKKEIPVQKLHQPESKVYGNQIKKMSKSEEDPRGRIELTDSPDIIREKVKKAVTDITSAVTFNPAERPGVSNLITIHSLCTGIPSEQICKQTQSLDTGEYKMVVADAIIDHFKPYRQQIEYLCAHPSYICETLRKGSAKASELAAETLNEVKQAMGLSLGEY